ncbi:hypothetical protein Avbf_06051 [Armadillidium vulgare]|nr:hypothetical protein Avbf_06051 [Armadillidium vulgare]
MLSASIHYQYDLPRIGCIETIENPLSWEEAKSQCSPKRKLLMIRGMNFKFLGNFVKQIGKKFWLDIKRDKYGYLRWGSGEYITKYFGFWGTNEPKASENGDDCGYVDETGKLVITSCNDTINFICIFY